MDGTSKVGGPGYAPDVKATPEDQALDILNNPRLGENEKTAQLEKAFSKLPDDEKAALYDKLKDRKSKDPMVQAFHYRLSHHAPPGKLSTTDQVLKSLNPDHGSPKPAGTPVSDPKTPKPSTKGPSPSGIDPKTQDAILRDKLLKEEKKTNFGPEIQSNSYNPMNTNEFSKISFAEDKLIQASPSDFKKILTESQNWAPAAKDAVTEAMRRSPQIMKRIATELTPDEQSKMIGRTFEDTNVSNAKFYQDSSKPQRDTAIRTYMETVPKEVLNKVLQDNATLDVMRPGRGVSLSSVKDQVSDGRFEAFGKLTLDNKSSVIAGLAKDNNNKTNSLQIHTAISQMKPDEKNAMIDKFQRSDRDALPALLDRMKYGIDDSFMQGINKENAEFIRDTYSMMAGQRGISDDDSNLFRKNAQFLKGWMEEAYKPVPQTEE